MSPFELALLTIAALFAGTVDAVAGGGGLITLPALLAAGLPEHVALGTNKGQSVWGSGVALIAFWRGGHVDRKQALLSFPLGLIGSLIGAQVVLLISKDALRPIVIVLLIGAAIVLVARRPAEGKRPMRRWVAALLAVGIACYDGFFGPGTGTFLIVGFVALCGRTLLQATADAKVVNFASNLAAVAAFAHSGHIRWEVAVPMAAGQLVGGMIGARLAIKRGAKLIRALVVAVSGALVVKLALDLV
ncbi:MAG: TSUP family transporter [Kofleriaceae bacterium]